MLPKLLKEQVFNKKKFVIFDILLDYSQNRFNLIVKSAVKQVQKTDFITAFEFEQYFFQ